MTSQNVLLTGATGFVGRAVAPALVAAGYEVRGMTRNLRRARQQAPERTWLEGDVHDAEACARALDGCQAAFYLVHEIGEASDYRRREIAAASQFARAAKAAGVERVIYLGGVAPQGHASDHLLSRLEVGQVLRAETKTVELRASMIVGYGSLSWLIVRDLVARLPVMVLPRWLKSRTQPVAIDDIVVALVRALALTLGESQWYDVPGPDILSGKEILEQTAQAMKLHHPYMMAVPFLTPGLSSLWVRFVTRAKWSVAREVVVGLTEDLIAQSDQFWSLIDHKERKPFAEAARIALQAEHEVAPVGGPWGVVERALRRKRP